MIAGEAALLRQLAETVPTGAAAGIASEMESLGGALTALTGPDAELTGAVVAVVETARDLTRALTELRTTIERVADLHGASGLPPHRGP